MKKLALILLGAATILVGQEDCETDADHDGDGWTVQDGDCDDNDANSHPGADEVCDGHDNDCDGEADGGALGGDETCAASSCLAVLDARPMAQDGFYWLDPYSSGDALEALCDMTSDGGGWTRCAWIDYLAEESTTTYGMGGQEINRYSSGSVLGPEGTYIIKSECFDPYDEKGFALTHVLEGEAGGPYDFEYRMELSTPVTGSENFAFITSYEEAGYTYTCQNVDEVEVSQISYPDSMPRWFFFGDGTTSSQCYIDGEYSGTSNGLWFVPGATEVANTWLELSDEQFDRLGTRDADGNTKVDSVAEFWVR